MLPPFAEVLFPPLSTNKSGTSFGGFGSSFNQRDAAAPLSKASCTKRCPFTFSPRKGINKSPGCNRFCINRNSCNTGILIQVYSSIVTSLQFVLMFFSTWSLSVLRMLKLLLFFITFDCKWISSSIKSE